MVPWNGLPVNFVTLVLTAVLLFPGGGNGFFFGIFDRNTCKSECCGGRCKPRTIPLACLLLLSNLDISHCDVTVGTTVPTIITTIPPYSSTSDPVFPITPKPGFSTTTTPKPGFSTTTTPKPTFPTTTTPKPGFPPTKPTFPPPFKSEFSFYPTPTPKPDCLYRQKVNNGYANNLLNIHK